MSRLDDLGEILDGYEGRKHKEEVSIRPEEINKAVLDITGRLGYSFWVIDLDFEAKEAIAKAYYTCLFCNAGSPKKQESNVNIFCQDLEVCLNNNPKKVKDFAEEYAKHLEENA